MLTTLQEVKDVSVLINNGLMGAINVFLFGLYVAYEILGLGGGSKQGTKGPGGKGKAHKGKMKVKGAPHQD